MRSKILFILKIFLIALVLNAIWEFWHVRFYTSAGTFQGTMPYPWFLIYAICWDAIFITVVYLGMALLKHSLYWIKTISFADALIVLFVSMATAVYVERRSLRMGKWAYNATMPLVPLLGVGLTPFIQLAFLSLTTFVIARYFIK